MNEKNKQFDAILRTLEELKDSKEPKSKDLWDKLGILGQLISGILLVALGLYVSWSIDKAQKNLAKQISESQIQSSKDITDAQINSSKNITDAQISSSKDIAESQIKSSKDIADLQSKSTMEVSSAQAEMQKDIAEAQIVTSKTIATSQTKSQEFAQKLSFDTLNRQIASDYLEKLISASNTNDRTALLDSLDIALTPKYSIPMAIRFTRPVQVRSQICKGEIYTQTEQIQQNALINKTAISLLRRLNLQDTKLLKEVSYSQSPTEAALAEDILGISSRVLIRVSEVDDFADIYLNNNEIYNYRFGRDSGWVEITNLLKPNDKNDLYVQIRNSRYQGSGIRFEVQVGAEQYDRFVYRADWTSEGPSFSIGLSISVDVIGKFHLNGDLIQVNGPIGVPHC